jgi:hypothetical protein
MAARHYDNAADWAEKYADRMTPFDRASSVAYNRLRARYFRGETLTRPPDTVVKFRETWTWDRR